MWETTQKNAPTPFIFNNNLRFDERVHYEILDGDPCLMPVPSIRHQTVALNIAAGLFRHVEERKLGRVFQAPCGIFLSEKTVLHPDVMFVERKRSGIIGRSHLRGAPDLVVEVLSPATREKDLRTKKKLYSRFQIPEYWIVDPEHNSIETMVWSELGYIIVGDYGAPGKLSSPLLPRLNLPYSSIFKYSDD
jgi:Uma2 family endonuclease